MNDTIITTTRVNVALFTHAERTSYSDADRYAELDALVVDRECSNELERSIASIRRSCTLNASRYAAYYDSEEC